MEPLPPVVAEELTDGDRNCAGLDEGRVAQEGRRGMGDGLLELPCTHAWQGAAGGRAGKGHPFEGAAVTHNHASFHGPNTSSARAPRDQPPRDSTSHVVSSHGARVCRHRVGHRALIPDRKIKSAIQ